ncbi:MAG: hypothetical protein M1298_03900 [Chloroflexi bacterium]|nr:hypothetical protein [Chloroflexota bacterium]
MARSRGRWYRPDPLPDKGECSPLVGVAPRPWAPLPFDPKAVSRQLLDGEIVACEPIPNGSNYSFAVGISCHRSGAEATIDHIAIYKPQRGEAPLWDFPQGTLYKREMAAYHTSQAIGWPFIPPTVVRSGPYGIGTVQLYIKPDASTHYYRWNSEHIPELMRITVFDYITNNADRKAAHCLLDVQRCVWGIDHGLTFHEDVKLRTAIQEFSSMRLPDWLYEEVRAFTGSARCQELLDELQEYISPREIRAFQRRLQRILQRYAFPALDSYDSTPREWW